ncbi:aminoglycoside phosphotransferase family protein [Alicyclobacillus fastidiosus]|uniref:Aminoglycoside phosphotransferase family protein n=1 Tax=Alicyclobacillus fastidiosus TaxID=392011 RepID=A0ABV5ACG8_9BACL|nr:aminoglycoside phosphotransferase family protein [Alicyclobacillus fastidiosus]WEH11907.1 aminoglycoside phosphotransferase family protein [Alicyclobacillus fastidiosus]
MDFVPIDFATRLETLYGQQGEQWLRDLPELLERCQERFDLRLEAPFPNLTWNLVLQASRCDGTPVVLKMAVRKAELYRERTALHAYSGRGGIQVLDADDDLGAVVLERADPGTALSTIEDDDLATGIFCSVFRALHGEASTISSASGPLVPIEEHFSGIERYRQRHCKGNAEPLSAYWVERASECLAYLVSSTRDRVVLHGDLHHDNILQHRRGGWAVIDPKGIVGDRHFDTIQFLLNYIERDGDPYTVLTRRIGIISTALRLSARRIAMWGLARGVLEACWTIEDGRTEVHQGVDIAKRFARYLDAIGVKD